MVPPTNFNPTTDPDDSTSSPTPDGVVKKDRPATKTQAPTTDDSTSKRPFKQVLDATMAEKALKVAPKPVKAIKSDDEDDEDEKVSPFDLAAKSNVQSQKAAPTITATRVFHDAPVTDKPSDVDVNVQVVAAVDDDLPKAVVAQPKIEDNARVQTGPQPVHAKDVKHAKDTEKAGVIKATGAVKEDIRADTKDTASVVVAAPQAINQPVAANVTVKKPEPVTNVRHVIEALAKSMVDEIAQVRTPGQTETTITLNYPPRFEGVKIKITELDTAPKQFNLNFSDVNDPTARALLTQTANQKQLQESLIAKGYTIQMITVEQKIPGLTSTETGDVALGQPRQQPEGGQAGSSTDKEQQ